MWLPFWSTSSCGCTARFTDLGTWEHTLEIRILAVAAYYKNKENLPAATHWLLAQVKKNTWHSVKAAKKFLKAQVKKFLATGSVHNITPGPSRTAEPAVPDDAALHAAAILKEGYENDQVLPTGDPQRPTQVVRVHSYYSTLSEALKHRPELMDICNQYGVTPKALLVRMHQVDDGLVKRTMQYKVPHTNKQRYARIAASLALLQMFRADPNLHRRVVWVDQATIWIVDDSHNTKRVWVDAHDKGVHYVINCPLMLKHKRIKVHILCGVNYELGAFFIQFTTGTTGIQRLHNQPDKTYLVSGSNHAYDASQHSWHAGSMCMDHCT